MVKVKGTTISIVRGDTANIKVTILDKDGNLFTPGENDTVRFAVKRSYYQTEPDILKTIPNETLMLELDSTDTKELAFGLYKYDIELTTEDGEVDTFIAMADFRILEEVH